MLEGCIGKTGLYHVFFREEDHYVEDGGKCAETELIKTFTTEISAVDWILKNGRKAISNDKRKPAVLTIIQFNNNCYCKDEEDLAYFLMIPALEYPTYAFTKDGYQMLLREHKKVFHAGWCSEIIPTWIHYVEEDGKIIDGCSLEYIEAIHSKIDYCSTQKQEEIARWHQLNTKS